MRQRRHWRVAIHIASTDEASPTGPRGTGGRAHGRSLEEARPSQFRRARRPRVPLPGPARAILARRPERAATAEPRMISAISRYLGIDMVLMGLAMAFDLEAVPALYYERWGSRESGAKVI